jgi:uncharacterized protein (DUF58 family)
VWPLRARRAAVEVLPREPPGESEAAAELLEPAFLARLERLTVVAKKLVEARRRGDRQAPKQRGTSLEFADYRDYAPGDPLRRIDWNVYARLERLLVRLYEGEHDLGIDLLIDCSESMAFGKPSKISEARRLAAALAYIALASHDRVRLVNFAGTAESATPLLSGKGNAQHVLRVLAGLRAGGVTDLSAAATHAGTGRTRARMAVILSDLLDARGLEAALGRLAAQRKRCAVIHITDETCDVAPPLTGELQLVDAETGETLEVDASPGALNQYTQQVESYCEAQATLCAQRGVGYMRARTTVPFEETILQALRESGVIG